MSFIRNLHSLDRLIRLLIAPPFIYLGFINQSTISNEIIAILIGLFGVINLFAGLVAHCPIYAFAGLSTYAKDDI